MHTTANTIPDPATSKPVGANDETYTNILPSPSYDARFDVLMDLGGETKLLNYLDTVSQHITLSSEERANIRTHLDTWWRCRWSHARAYENRTNDTRAVFMEHVRSFLDDPQASTSPIPEINDWWNERGYFGRCLKNATGRKELHAIVPNAIAAYFNKSVA